MTLTNLESQPLGAHQVRVQVISSRVNPVDIDLMNGMPFISYKSPQIGGIDGAGQILETGKAVSDLKAGDTIFFYRKFTDIGTWAEEIAIDRADVATIPDHLSPQDAGAIALPLLTAHAALKQLEALPGSHILIQGAAGGVGLQATQLAVQMGLEVIGTASARDRDFLLGLGVKKVIDYRNEDFSKVLANEGVDYIFDLIGGEVLLKSIGLKPKAVVSTSYPDMDKMDNTGINMPGILKAIMKLATGKFPRRAKKLGVKLIGQVTGPDAELMQEASDLAAKGKFVLQPYPKLPLSKVAKSGMAETKVGTVLLMQV